MICKIVSLPIRFGDTKTITSIYDGDLKDEANILIDSGLNSGSTFGPGIYLPRLDRSFNLLVITYSNRSHIPNFLPSFPKMGIQQLAAG